MDRDFEISLKVSSVGRLCETHQMDSLLIVFHRIDGLETPVAHKISENPSERKIHPWIRKNVTLVRRNLGIAQNDHSGEVPNDYTALFHLETANQNISREQNSV